MATSTLLFFSILPLFLHLHVIFSLTLQNNISNVYIVYMGERKHEDPDVLMGSHHEMLATLLGSKGAAMESMVYSYRHGFSGFAAILTQAQAKEIEEFSGVVRVIRNEIHQLHTTRSSEFLGLYPPSPVNLAGKGKQGEGVIIGVIDTGIWPESDSFKDDGMGQIPTKWKGMCQVGPRFTTSNCNRKLIGAQWFVAGQKAVDPRILVGTNEVESARDMSGHGTHTASTAAGSLVQNTNFMGVANGIAKGVAPRAHVAVYKACWNTRLGCTTADILKAFDTAVHDGVDILSFSIGNVPPLPRYMDGNEIGAFHAMANGITVVSSAGNSGPVAQTVGNTAPWMLTVGSTTIDRSFPTEITLGNNIKYKGQALYRGRTTPQFLGLVYSQNCIPGSLNPSLVSGKVVLCFRKQQQHISEAYRAVELAGGDGVIFAEPPNNNLVSCGSKPCVAVSYDIGTKILNYIQQTASPTVQITSSATTVGNLVSPTVSYFSSRGPSSLSRIILKPDIVAPGSDILAAWSPESTEHTNEKYVIISGTSMACPHVSGIVALLKVVWPNWSPAMIRSALVTTASTTDIYGQRIEAESGVRKLADPFDYGGGQVNPNAASDPGLVYDMSSTDNAVFLCAMGYSSQQISGITNFPISCPQISNTRLMLDLNLPSITIPNLKDKVVISRTVTNVGAVVGAVYTASVEPPPGVTVDVTPRTLSFNANMKTRFFQVQFTASKQKQGFYTFGSLTWSDGVHTVRIPIAVRTTLEDDYDGVSWEENYNITKKEEVLLHHGIDSAEPNFGPLFN